MLFSPLVSVTPPSLTSAIVAALEIAGEERTQQTAVNSSLLAVAPRGRGRRKELCHRAGHRLGRCDTETGCRRQ